MRIVAIALTALLALPGVCGTLLPTTADPASDAPEAGARPLAAEVKDAPSHGRALELWRTPEDVNAWIGAKFTDSKRPGHLYGPYDSDADFIAEYAAWRNRTIVAYSERDSYQRQQRTKADRQARVESRL